jgi:hypothetical protein
MLCGTRLFVGENEGGYSSKISAQVILESIAPSGDLSRKKINLKVNAKGLDFFETVESI